jgi:hypothetical protein
MSTVSVDHPGVYDLPAQDYHSDPVPGGSLSCSGAKRLLPPSCPALFRHWTDNGQESTKALDLGKAAHAQVLDIGDPIAVVDADDWRTKAAQQKRKDAYTAGHVPLLATDYEQVQAMATALRQHPVASALLRPGTGEAEQSLFWTDPETGICRRAMLDWLPDPTPGRVLIVPDYKTTVSAEPSHIARVVANYGYHQQHAWYLDGAEALDLVPDPGAAFVFIFQEKTPPYLITVAQLVPETVQWGRVLNRRAIDIYRSCTETGRWPGYGDAIQSVALPTWEQRRLEAAWERGAYDPIHDLEDIAS